MTWNLPKIFEKFCNIMTDVELVIKLHQSKEDQSASSIENFQLIKIGTGETITQYVNLRGYHSINIICNMFPSTFLDIEQEGQLILFFFYICRFCYCFASILISCRISFELDKSFKHS